MSSVKLTNNESFFGGFVLGVVITTFAAIVLIDNLGDSSVFYTHGYKQGQIDHANNIIRYELVKQKDGTTIWQRVQDTK